MPKRKRKNSESQKKRQFSENQVVNSEDEEGEWEVAKILEEKLTEDGAKVHVLWTAGDKTWEPVSEFANVKQYLDFRSEQKAKDVAQPQEPLKLEQRAAFYDSEARKKCKKLSNYVGVAWHEKSKKWRSYVRYKLEFVFVGEFSSELKAAEASNDKCDELCIPRSNLSIPDKKVKTCTHKPTKQDHRGESLYCDVCKEPQLQTSVVIGCRQCDWDECAECYKIVKSKGSKMTLKQCRKFLKQRDVPYSRRCSAQGLKQMVQNVWKTSHPYTLGSTVMAKYRDGRFYEAKIVEIMLEEAPKLFKMKWKDDTQSDLWKAADEIIPKVDYDSDSDEEDYSQKPEFQNVFFQRGEYFGKFIFQDQKFSSDFHPSPRLAAIEVNELCARVGISPKNVIPPSSFKSEPTNEKGETGDNNTKVSEPKLKDPAFRAHNYMDDVSDDNKERFHCPFGCSNSYKNLQSLRRHFTINKNSNGCPMLNKQNVLLSPEEIHEIAQNVKTGGNVYVGPAAKMKINKIQVCHVNPVKEETDKSSSIPEESDSDLSSEEANPPSEKKKKSKEIHMFKVNNGPWIARGTFIDKNGIKQRKSLGEDEDRDTCRQKCLRKCEQLKQQGFKPFWTYGHPRAVPQKKKPSAATNQSRKRKTTNFGTPSRKKRKKQTPPPQRPPPLDNQSSNSWNGLKSGTFVNGFTEGMIVRMHDRYAKRFGIVQSFSGSTVRVTLFEGLTIEGDVSRFCKSNRAELAAFAKIEEERLKNEETELELQRRKQKKELDELKKALDRKRAEQARELANLEQEAKTADKIWKHNKQALAKKLLEIDQVEQEIKNARQMRAVLKKKHKEGKENLAQLQRRNTKAIERRKAVLHEKTEAKQKAQSVLDDWDLKHESQKEFLEKAKMFLESKE